MVTKKPTKMPTRGPKPLELNVITEMCNNRAKGWTIDAIAKHFGVSHGTASFYVRGVIPPEKVSKKQKDLVRMLRSAGYRFAEIKEHTQLGLVTIKKLCADVVIPGHYAGQKLPEDVAQKIKDMRAEGVPFLKIADVLGVGWGTVIRYGKDVEVPKRNRGHRILPRVATEIVERLKLDHSYSDIALSLDVSIQTVKKYELKEAARELLESGQSIEGVAAETGLEVKQVEIYAREFEMAAKKLIA